MAEAVFLLLVASIAILFLLYYVKIKGVQFYSVLSASEAVSTIIIASFSLYCASMLYNQPVVEPQSFNNTMYENTIVNTSNEITEDMFTTTVPIHEKNETIEYLKQYQQLLSQLIHNKSRQKRSSSFSTYDCLYTTFLRQALFVYSFIRGVTFLFGVTIDCRACKKQMSIEDKTSEVNQGRHDSKLVICILIDWLIPGISTLLLYYAIMGNDSDGNAISVDFMYFNKPNNSDIPTIENTNNTVIYKEEINNIIKNVYNIVNSESKAMNSETVKPNIFKLHNQRPFKENDCRCSTIEFKIYVFLIIILSYICSLFYSKITEVKTTNPEKRNNLKLNLYFFALCWVPGVMETFFRTYIDNTVPAVLAELFTLAGNVNHILINARNVVMVAQQLKNNNFIEPQS